jgi:hypothetical protein
MFWCLCIALFGLPNILPIVLLFILTHGGQMQDNGKDEICKRDVVNHILHATSDQLELPEH